MIIKLNVILSLPDTFMSVSHASDVVSLSFVRTNLKVRGHDCCGPRPLPPPPNLESLSSQTLLKQTLRGPSKVSVVTGGGGVRKAGFRFKRRLEPRFTTTPLLRPLFCGPNKSPLIFLSENLLMRPPRYYDQ